MPHGSMTEKPMGRPKSHAPKTHTVRITDEAHEIASVASGLVKMSVPDWVSMAIVAQGNLAIDNFMETRRAEKEKKGE